MNSHYLDMEFDQLKTRFDPDYRALWCTLKSSVSPVFSITLLKNIRLLQDMVAQYSMEFHLKKPMYMIWTSDCREIFSLGVDLQYIHELIQERDENRLREYLELSIDVLYINIKKFDIDPLITISLIRGKTYGCGFESALTTDLILAEENARCAFPGVQYNLLPSIGILKLILRRFPRKLIDPLLFNGKCLDANILLKHKLIDSLVKTGTGEEAVRNKLMEMHDKHSYYTAIYNAIASDYMPVQNDLEEFKDIWLKKALELRPCDVLKLGRMAEAQAIIMRRTHSRTSSVK